MMTTPQRNGLRRTLIATGTIAPTVLLIFTLIDHRYVHRDEWRLQMTIDSTERVENAEFRRLILIKEDSTNQRLQQIQCGPAVARGCR